jgi:hypothetical protein
MIFKKKATQLFLGGFRFLKVLGGSLVLLVGTRDLRPLWSPPVSLNLVHALVF